MASRLEQQLKESGKKLQHYASSSKPVLLRTLTQVAGSLSKVEQSPPRSILKAMSLIMNTLVKPGLLGHSNGEVAVLVATCISEIMRIMAPEAPYDDNVLKEIFHLFNNCFHGLADAGDPHFGRRMKILETAAKIRSCVLMLDLECTDLILRTFKIFFSTVR
eukprot:TRINITY_DN3843_c0_g1_i6.p1 TRINITY_DN3843_c0_g1~~TRINITY_DN3843_c0_g1_i6.p1  ORF type:complete len:162 (+),score=25.85 TRINITY_DN3843_c0_g1_i6:156-641(+)